MKLLFKAALLASTFAIASLSVAAPAMAASISFNFGNVAVGYSDGYWDNSHKWHRWANARQASQYRAKYHDNYHAMRHTKAPNQGWREH